MNQYFGFYPGKIVSVNREARTAMVKITPFTNGLENGIEATFAYPLSHDDKDTELEILNDVDVYIFFDQGDPMCPVIWSYRSHGEGAVLDYRRIRQTNIELYAKKNIKLEALEEVTINAKTLRINADIIHTGKSEQTGDSQQIGNSKQTGDNTVTGGLKVSDKSELAGGAKIGGKEFDLHTHNDSHGSPGGPPL